MDLYFSTVVRGARISAGGELLRLDWDNKRVVARTPIVPDPMFEDPNPRGNTRGGKGIELVDDGVLVCSYHTLKIFDPHLNHRRDITHGLMVGLHETFCPDQSRIWITSTAIDAALQFDLSSGALIQSYWPLEMPPIQEAFGVEPAVLDKGADNRGRFLGKKHGSHVHLNAVSSWRDDIYALFNRYGAIVNLTKREVVTQDARLKGAHNLLVLEDGTAIVNDTRGQTVRFYDLTDGHLLHMIDLMNFRWVRMLLARDRIRSLGRNTLSLTGLGRPRIARPLFVRGLDLVDNHLFVGLSPASILCIDLNRSQLVDAYCFSWDIYVTVHGVRVVR